jgi:hypothetical protein
MAVSPYVASQAACSHPIVAIGRLSNSTSAESIGTRRRILKTGGAVVA